jgi:NAD(P)-dependent dehydrogenase (short-subunit alcohol dehydrogenase family)
MIANASIIRFVESALPDLQIYVRQATAEDWDRKFSVNVKGTFFCYKHAGLQMVAQGRGGRIIGA